MTRINCVPVEELSNAHMFAEYREIFRIASKSRVLRNPITSYRMGKGHMMFFYDKALYLKKRTDQLYRALRKRGYKVEYWPYPVEKHPIGYRNDWTPSSDDQVICRSRITERIAANPSKHSWEVLKG